MGLTSTFCKWARSILDEARLSYQREDMIALTDGLNVPNGFFDRMRERGWEIREHGSGMIHTKYVPYRYERKSPTAMETRFSAMKNGHQTGSAQWYRDMADVLGYPRDAIPDEAMRARRPDRDGPGWF